MRAPTTSNGTSTAIPAAPKEVTGQYLARNNLSCSTRAARAVAMAKEEYPKVKKLTLEQTAALWRVSYRDIRALRASGNGNGNGKKRKSTLGDRLVRSSAAELVEGARDLGGAEAVWNLMIEPLLAEKPEASS